MHFDDEVKTRVNSYEEDTQLHKAKEIFIDELTRVKNSYNFYWLGRPIFQQPTDLQVIQEIIYEYKPDLIIETGIARGGSLIYYASIMVMLEYCKEIENGQVIGIDIDMREHNKQEILKHPMNEKITIFEGSSIDSSLIQKVKEFAKDKKRVMVVLDSNHTHDHVLEELKAYAPLISKGGYCIVCDTGIENTDKYWDDRPWGKGNSPMSAVFEYIKTNTHFEIDKFYELKSLITGMPNGFLKKVK